MCCAYIWGNRIAVEKTASAKGLDSVQGTVFKHGDWRKMRDEELSDRRSGESVGS